MHIRPMLLDLLLLLARSPGRIVSKEEINRTIWGRRFLAESALTRLVAELRAVLADDVRSPRFIETVPKRGYRLLARVSREGSAAETPAQRLSVAVLPFTDMAAERDLEYFCDGLSEELTNALTRVRSLRVIARTSAFAFKGKAVDVREIGRQLQVSAIVEGCVQRSADRLRITVQLVETADGSHLWSDRFDRRTGDIFAIQDEIAQSVVSALRVKLPGLEEAGSVRRHTHDLEGYDLYLRGRYMAARRTPDGYAQAIRCFEQALTLDPAYALAYSALGACCCGSGFIGYIAPWDAFPKARAAAAKALELDPTLAEAHGTLGWVSWAYDWEWLASERHFLRAEELSPADGMIRFWHAMLLAALGRFDDAHAEIERAWDLDPLSLVIQTNIGYVHFEARQYEEAIARCSKVLEMDPTFALASFHLGRTYLVCGNYGQAIATLEPAVRDFPLAMASLAGAWAGVGRRDRAQAILRELEGMSTKQYVGHLAFSLVHRALGDTDAGLDWMEKAFDAHEGVIALFGVDPEMDQLRSNPRFAALLQRLKLPDQAGCAAPQ